MLNQTILVGRLTKDPEIKNLPDGKTVTEITLAVQRNFKNAETFEYETDFIKCNVWQALAVNLGEYCKKGSVIGVKGRLVQRKVMIDDEKYLNVVEVIAESISYISTK